LPDFSAGWKQKILFLSDIHLDSPWCDRKLLKKHLDEAVETNAIIMCAGDLFDCMQGPKDPRASYRELKDIYKHNDYFDCVLDDVADFLKPYSKNIAMIGYGNHEYSVSRHNGTDMIQRIICKLRDMGSPAVAGGYGGYIKLSVFDNHMKTPRDSYKIAYNHGAGGDAPVTKGMIATNRQATYLNDFNLVWNGHNHNSYITQQATIKLSGKDEIEQGLVTFIRTPGYKNEYDQPGHGYAVSKNMSPTPRGCVWGEFSYYWNKIQVRYFADVI
jgi:predicted phosphodiesterase